MSRRPAAPPVGRINTARARMAPGGRMWSESPILFPRRRVAMSGAPISGDLPDTIDRIKVYDGFADGSAGGGTKTVTLAAGDAAMVVLWGTPVETITAPDGWTVHEEFVTAGGFSDTTRHCVASITNAAAGSHVFDYTLVGTPSIRGVTLAGHLLRRGDSSPVGGTWHYLKGPTRIPYRSFKFITPDPTWSVWWQEAFCTAVYTGLEDLPPVLPTGSGRPGFTSGEGSATDSYEWPRSEVLSHYLAGEPYQEPAPTDNYVDGNIYAFGNIGAYGTPSSVPMTFGWTP